MSLVAVDHNRCQKRFIFLQESRLSKCPVCALDFDTEDSDVAIPSPFVVGADTAASVVVRPTNGSFLDTYTVGQDLHVGVSAFGRVLSYSKAGVTAERSEWQCSLSVFQADDAAFFHAHLDAFLKSAESQFTPAAYDEHRFNCFDFALAFLSQSRLLPANLLGGKQAFVEQFVRRRIDSACKYVGVYRRVRRDGFVAGHLN